MVMVQFGTGYFHPMDRDYGSSSTADNSTNDVGVGIKDIGFSVPFGIAASNVPGVASKIRTGARVLELQFPGASRSQRGAQTPGVYGKLQRQALEEMSRSTGVDFTTHGSFSVMGLAGMDQQGNFSRAAKQMGVDEIKRAIEFAADVARGGNVTIHTGEFQRPISTAPWNTKGKWTDKFKRYGKEEEEAPLTVIDDRTGHVMIRTLRNKKVPRPIWNTAEPGEEYIDFDNKRKIAKKDEIVYIDYEGKRVPRAERVPKFDKEHGEFLTKMYSWEDFERDAEEMTREARKFWRENKNNPEKWKDSPWARFQHATSENEIEIRPEEAYAIATLETNAAQARGWAYHYQEGFEKDLERIAKLRKAREIYKKIEDAATTEEEKFLLRQQIEDPELRGLIPPDTKMPLELIDERIRDIDRRMKQRQEGASGQWAQVKENEEMMRHAQSSESYALKESYDAYAQAGISAMERSNQLEKKGELKQPIFVAMEHIFPESYGGHPDELIDLVEGSRKRMAELLMQQKGYNEEQARKEAEEHIKGHLDTGHLNIWRKYWQGDPKKTPEENDKEFTAWMLEKIEEMAKKNIIGSVHLNDNWGYNDEHLSPGEGNAHVKEMVEILKKHGFKGPLVVEPGADATTDLSDFHGLMKTWRLFGSSIYGVGIGRPPARSRKWGDVQYGYFGRMESPYFVFGPYSPSEDWTLWSGVPLE
jgi:sugar phosphate isomerase/epimerase